MKKCWSFIIFLYSLSVFDNYAQIANYDYSPSTEELTVDYRTVISFGVFINPNSGDYNGWSSKIEVSNATNASQNPQTGTSGSWFVDFTTANTQATVKISCLKNNTLLHSKTWKITVRPSATLSISGSDEIKEGSTVIYTANYTGTSTNYQWSSVNGKLNILSGQGTNKITVSPKVTEGTDQIKVTAGGLSATKNVTISSWTNNIINQNITSNRDFSNRYINISNTNITNNAIVNITAEQTVTITPNFFAQQGTKVTIKATVSTLRSGSIDNDEEDLSENIFEAPIVASINDIKETFQTVRVNIYSITGLLVYSSTTDFDIKSANLSLGIYVIEIINNRDEIKREKVLINR